MIRNKVNDFLKRFAMPLCGIVSENNLFVSVWLFEEKSCFANDFEQFWKKVCISLALKYFQILRFDEQGMAKMFKMIQQRLVKQTSQTERIFENFAK